MSDYSLPAKKQIGNNVLPVANNNRKPIFDLPALDAKTYQDFKSFLNDNLPELAGTIKQTARATEIKQQVASWVDAAIETDTGCLLSPIPWGYSFYDAHLYGLMDTSVLRAVLILIEKESWELEAWGIETQESLTRQAKTFATHQANQVNTTDLIVFFNQLSWADIVRAIHQNNLTIDEISLQKTFRQLVFVHARVQKGQRSQRPLLVLPAHLYILALEVTKDGYWDLRAFKRLLQRFDPGLSNELAILAAVAKELKNERCQNLGTNLAALVSQT